jgi:hypothetical protein
MPPVSDSTPRPPVPYMLVLRNITCGHALMASSTRPRLQAAQAELVVNRGRRDFRIQTVTAAQAVTTLLDLKAGVFCPTCELDRPLHTQPDGTPQ